MIVRVTRASIVRSSQGDPRSSQGHPPAGPWRPTKEQLEAARGKGVRDVIAPRLRVLFCGINPGLYTAAIGHHFGRPGNRFWTALHAAGFTDRVVSPFEERELIERGLGITNLVNKATRVAEELDADDLRAGAKRLEAKVKRHRPRILAVLGLGAYRVAFGRPRATIGEQPERIGRTRVWVLPNPSGRTASYQLEAIADLMRELRRAGSGRSTDRAGRSSDRAGRSADRP